jgi:hypothetical protein
VEAQVQVNQVMVALVVVEQALVQKDRQTLVEVVEEQLVEQGRPVTLVVQELLLLDTNFNRETL